MSAKSVYEQQLRNKLNEWNKQISELKDKADHAPDPDTKADYNGQVEEIHALQQSVREKVETIEIAEETAWEHLKEDIEIVWEKLETAIKKLASIFD
jgi:hypothetical protein